jgi:hypothetical protein
MASITVQICTTVPIPRKQAGHIVTLRAATTGQEISQPTDSNGRAIFPNMASAAYDIFVCDIYKMRFAYGGGDVTKYVPTSCPDIP